MGSLTTTANECNRDLAPTINVIPAPTKSALMALGFCTPAGGDGVSAFDIKPMPGHLLSHAAALARIQPRRVSTFRRDW